MNKERYTGISLKKDLVQKIKTIVENDISYSSTTEFIRTAVREKLKRMEGN